MLASVMCPVADADHFGFAVWAMATLNTRAARNLQRFVRWLEAALFRLGVPKGCSIGAQARVQCIGSCVQCTDSGSTGLVEFRQRFIFP